MSNKKKQADNPRVTRSRPPRKTTNAKMLRAHKKRLERNPTTPSGR